MHITAIETIALSRMHEPERQWFTATRRIVKADAAIIVIHTDADEVGIGEATPYGGPALIRAWVQWLAQDLIGREIDEANLIPSPSGREVTSDFPHIPPYDAAVAGLDCALWDLRAKRAGKRVCDLITNAAKATVPVYASGGVAYDWRAHPETVIAEVLRYRDQGFTTAKLRLGTEWRWDGVTVERFLGLMRDLAGATAGSIGLAVDGNGRLSYDQALPIAQELERLGFHWFEEPMPLTAIDAYCQLSRSVGLPISGGEGFTTLAQFRPYFERQALSIIQPDVACCGLTEALRIARMAERYGIRVVPHNWHNGLMTLANAHFVAACPNAPFLELCMVQGPLQWDMLVDAPAMTASHLALPATPGFGGVLREQLRERYPYLEGHYAVPVTRDA